MLFRNDSLNCSYSNWAFLTFEMNLVAKTTFVIFDFKIPLSKDLASGF